MVFNDLGICIHALRIGLGDYPQSDPCLWFRGEQLTGVLLLFLTYTDLLALQECVHIQLKPYMRQLTFCSCKVGVYIDSALELIQFLCFACERRFLYTPFTPLTQSEARLLCAASICAAGWKEAHCRGRLPAQPHTDRGESGESYFLYQP